MRLLERNFLMGIELNDLIQIHEKTLEPNICNFLIELFETHSTNCVFNLTDNRDISDEVSEIHQNLIKIVIDAKQNYYEHCYLEVFPEANAFEKFTITKYQPNEETGPTTKVDVKSYDEARRFLCFKWFLNDNSGGQIRFVDLNIQPEQGNLIIYPPMWMYPYREKNVVDTPKYILTTYLHYK